MKIYFYLLSGPIEVQEVKLKSGEMQTKLVKRPNEFQSLIKQMKKPDKKKNLDPRSDLSDEDEIIEELVKTVKNLNQNEKEALKELKSSLQKEVENSIEDIVEETEGEMNVKLDGLERSNAIQELHKTLQVCIYLISVNIKILFHLFYLGYLFKPKAMSFKRDS